MSNKNNPAAAPQSGAAAVPGAEASGVENHTITQQDLDNNPELVKAGHKVGDVIEVEPADSEDLPAAAPVAGEAEKKPGKGRIRSGANTAAGATKKAEASASSVSIGKKVDKLEFLRFKHPDGRDLLWKLSSQALIACDGDRFTPADLHADKTPDRLLKFVAEHPAYFEEIFE